MPQPKSEILAIIPGKGRSERVPNKNLRTLGNKPLIAWTIEAALGSKLLSRIVVSTEDHRVAAVAQAWGVEVVSHPPLDELPEVPDVCLHVLDVLGAKRYVPETVVCLLPSSPFRTSADIDAAIKQSRDHRNPKAPNLLSTSQPRHHIGAVVNYQFTSLERPEQHNGAILLAPTERLRYEGFFSPQWAMAYRMNPISGLDINTEQDFKYAERIAAKMLAKVTT